MAMAYSYANRDAFKTWLQGIATSNTTHNATMDAILLAATREIDKQCGRSFQPYTATKTFTARDSGYLKLADDLLSVTSIKTDDNGDRTYENTWATTDYDLEPYNAADEEAPYTSIRTAPQGTKSFTGGRKGVEIVGTWGYWSSTISVGTLGSAITSTTATSVTMTTGHSVKPLQTILVGLEQMFVTEVATDTLTVKRGVNGTTAATALNAAAVTAYEYPSVIAQAAYLIANRQFERRNAPLGIAGNAEMGVIRLKTDPDIARMLDTYSRVLIGAV